MAHYIDADKLRAEIERLKKEGENGDALAQANNDYESHLQWGQQIAVANGLLSKLSFLSDLEKSEEPINIDFEQELYKHFGQVKDFTLGMQIGKYFYELGCRRTAEKYDEIEYKRQRADVCEGEDEEYEQIKQKVCSDCPSHKDDDCGYVTRQLQRKCNYLSDVMYGYELGRQSKEQPLLPGFENEQPGIPGKDFVPVAWCDALEQYGIWRIERVEQPFCEGLEEEMARMWAKTCHLNEKKDQRIATLDSIEFVNLARHFAKCGAEHLKK